jgi:hypothetical protein
MRWRLSSFLFWVPIDSPDSRFRPFEKSGSTTTEKEGCIGKGIIAAMYWHKSKHGTFVWAGCLRPQMKLGERWVLRDLMQFRIELRDRNWDKTGSIMDDFLKRHQKILSFGYRANPEGKSSKSMMHWSPTWLNGVNRQKNELRGHNQCSEIDWCTQKTVARPKRKFLWRISSNDRMKLKGWEWSDVEPKMILDSWFLILDSWFFVHISHMNELHKWMAIRQELRPFRWWRAGRPTENRW